MTNHDQSWLDVVMQIDKMAGKPVQPNQEPYLIKYFFLVRERIHPPPTTIFKNGGGYGEKGEMAL